ncbi:NAD(P)-binding domain-containing protein [Aquimarina sp. 2201CG5-10]|uniref:NAD(P)-binding domain-containing protein n=1 Tax=Aquimarina callyspongiae TaxID=3098150 RepID=UPI002AB4B7D5|nr:NAD(P)-binding domain-containing protein [Aquimarina sp. 2201CG5-10]MDY8136613.1 NAD(P)-binding domain-containing protein [Aquimarina sp. 2201CG5-10]
MNIKNISVLGCGWLGFPLAIDLISKGIQVKGSTTTESKTLKLQEQKITPFLLKLGEATEEIYSDFLLDSEVVIINFPPKRIPNIIEIYQQQIQSILSHISETQKVIFISSTSVYQNTNDEISEIIEIQPEKESGKAVAAVEQLLQKRLGDRLTILRLSGLIGYDRLPGRFLANKKNVQNGDAPINVIHRDDCIGLINAVLEKNVWGEVINGCADHHPLRKEFYSLAASKIGLTPPIFAKQEMIKYKIISNAKSKALLQYTYLHPDPLKLI